LPELALDLKSIQEAAKRIAPYIHETPVLSSNLLDYMAKGRLNFS
jgi:threonine dehydratase